MKWNKINYELIKALNRLFKPRYDLAVSLGPACSCSQTLRRARLQWLSFPFDWIGPDFGKVGWDDDVRRRIDVICKEFRGWLDKTDFKYRAPHPTNGMDIYFNHALHMVFNHDFPAGVPLDESYPRIEAKYRRRTSRLISLLRRSRRVLLTRVDRPDLAYRTPLEDCVYARKRLEEKFPDAKVDFLLMQPEKDIPFEKRIIDRPAEGVFRIRFDYQAEGAGMEAFPNLRQTARAARQLFAVRDYRSPEEKRSEGH